MPHSRPMPVIAPGCHELRVPDKNVTWRVVYYVAPDAVIILDVFKKKGKKTPKSVVEKCRSRLRAYLEAAKE